MNTIVTGQGEAALGKMYAYCVGIILSSLGWTIFGVGFAFFDYGSGRSFTHMLAGILIVPGWLLLRFCNSLFPFVRRCS